MVANFLKTSDNSDAYLYRIDASDQFIKFAIPPQTLEESVTSQWEQYTPLSGGLPRHIRQKERSLTLQIPNLVLDGYMARSSVNPTLGQIKAMIDNGMRVGFVWADFRISPVVITRMQVARTMWVDGLCVRAKVDLTLERSHG